MKKKDKKYRQLEKELQPYREVLSKAKMTILDKAVSEFPIMVLHKQEVEIGIPLIDRHKVAGQWSVNASTLEEFVAKQLIEEQKIESFKSLLQSHAEDLCLFVLSEIGANFVFLPENK